MCRGRSRNVQDSASDRLDIIAPRRRRKLGDDVDGGSDVHCSDFGDHNLQGMAVGSAERNPGEFLGRGINYGGNVYGGRFAVPFCDWMPWIDYADERVVSHIY